MKKVLLSSTTGTPSSSATNYTFLHDMQSGVWTGFSNSLQTSCYIHNYVRITNFTVDLLTAPGAGKSWTFTIVKNGSDTGLTVTISDTNTQASISTAVAFGAPGDYWGLKSVPSGTPTAPTKVSWSALVETPGKTDFIVSTNSGNASTSARNFVYPNASHQASYSASDSNGVRVYAPHSFRITKFYVYISTAPGAAKSWVFSIYKNGSDEVTSQITLTGTGSGAGITQGNVTGLTIDFSATDFFTVSCLPSGTPSTFSSSKFYLEIEPVNDGETIFSASPTTLSQTLTTWYRPLWPGVAGITASEDSSKLICPVNTIFYVKNFRALVSSAPGSGAPTKSRTFTIRKNAGAANNSIAITGTNTTGTDLSSVDKFVGLDFISSQMVPANTPATANAVHYATLYVPPENPMMGCNF